MPKAAELLRFLYKMGYRRVRQTGSHLMNILNEQSLSFQSTLAIYQKACF